MLVYIGFICCITLLMILDKTNFMIRPYSTKKDHSLNENRIKLSLLFSISIFILFIFTAFRFDVGWDYMAYFNTIEISQITNITTSGEFANNILVELSKFTNMTNFYFFINAFICILGIVVTIKNYSRDVWLSLFFFIGFPLFYLNSLSVIRLFTALAITFYGFKYVVNKNMIKFIVTVLLASMFHKSALIALVFYFIKDIKLKTHKLVLILVILPVVSNLVNHIVVNYFPRYAIYTFVTADQEGTKAILIFLIIGVISLVLRNKIINNTLTNSYYNFYFFGLCVYLMFFNQGTMGHRLSLYGTIYSLLLLPRIVSLFPNKYEKAMINVLICLVCIVSFLFTISVGSETYIPYKTIWSINS